MTDPVVQPAPADAAQMSAEDMFLTTILDQEPEEDAAQPETPEAERQAAPPPERPLEDSEEGGRQPTRPGTWRESPLVHSQDVVTVCFLHVGAYHHYEPKFVASVRSVMPEAKIVQFSDETSPEIPGVHEVRRQVIKTPLWVHRWQAYSEVEGEIVCLDTDVIVRKDLSRVFALDFDVALTRRDKPLLDPNGTDITQAMPFNGGVVLSRSRKWMRKLAETCAELTSLNQKWYTDQMAMTVCARTQPETVLHLPCELYNFTPDRQDSDTSHAWVVHYKGKRKEWMLAGGAKT